MTKGLEDVVAGPSCGRRKWRVRPRRVLAGVVVGAAIVFTVLAWPMDREHYLDVMPSGEIVDRNGELIGATLNAEEQWCLRRTLADFSPALADATLAAEDQRFYGHSGVDPLAVMRAVGQLLRNGRIVSGASTITMQVVKMADRTPRSFFGKIGQALQAVRLELRASKAEILTTYLNRAPYGANLEGAEAAARRYFGKSSRMLSPAEAALLAGLPKSPTRLNPLIHSAEATTRRNWVLARMLGGGRITPAEYADAVASSPDVEWHSFPQDAPHLTERFRSQLAAGETIRTTLDAQLQRRAAKLVRAHVDAAAGEVANAAVMVLDVKSGATLVRIGSPDFFSPQAGQVDACLAARSPGSALKPFTYGLALVGGLVYPNETLDDAPIDFGAYMPRNFDREFSGPLPMGEALRQSLNIPAALVLQRLGPDRLLELLRRCSLTTFRQGAEDYGVGLTLGGCEVRLEELIGAYGMIANLGEMYPVRLLRDEPLSQPRRIFREDTCIALFRLMEQPLPGDYSRNTLGAAQGAPRVCWKTGTSTGYHDAWAFVFNRRYVVGVWMGNADGRPAASLIGAVRALPLATSVFLTLDRSGIDWPTTEGAATPVEVCSLSGLPATRWCPATRTEIVTGSSSSRRLCTAHRSPESTRPPAEMQALRIVQPATGSRFLLAKSSTANRLPLRADAGTGPLHWYLDGMHLGVSTNDQTLLLDLAPGQHHLSVLDGRGMTASSEFEVHESGGMPGAD